MFLSIPNCSNTCVLTLAIAAFSCSLLLDDVGGQFRGPRGAGPLAEQAEESKGAQPRSTVFRQSRSAVAVFRGTSPVTGRIEW